MKWKRENERNNLPKNIFLLCVLKAKEDSFDSNIDCYYYYLFMGEQFFLFCFEERKCFQVAGMTTGCCSSCVSICIRHLFYKRKEKTKDARKEGRERKREREESQSFPCARNGDAGDRSGPSDRAIETGGRGGRYEAGGTRRAVRGGRYEPGGTRRLRRAVEAGGTRRLRRAVETVETAGRGGRYETVEAGGRGVRAVDWRRDLGIAGYWLDCIEAGRNQRGKQKREKKKPKKENSFFLID